MTRPRHVLVNFATSRDEREYLKRAAASRGVPIAQMIRGALARDGVDLKGARDQAA